MSNRFTLYNILSEADLWEHIQNDKATDLVVQALLDCRILDKTDFWEIRLQPTEKTRFQALILFIDIVLLKERRAGENGPDCASQFASKQLARGSVVDVVAAQLESSLTCCGFDRQIHNFLDAITFIFSDYHVRDSSHGLCGLTASIHGINQKSKAQLATPTCTSATLDFSQIHHCFGRGFEPDDPCVREMTSTTTYSRLSEDLPPKVRDEANGTRPITSNDAVNRSLDCAKWTNVGASCDCHDARGELIQSRPFDYISAAECLSAERTQQRDRQVSSLIRLKENSKSCSVCASQAEIMGRTTEKHDDERRDQLDLVPQSSLGSFNWPYRRSLQKVTVRNGEITKVLARQQGKTGSLSVLDKLRSLSSTEQLVTDETAAYCDATVVESDGGFVSHDDAEDDSSSFASASSFSSEILNGWLDEDDFDLVDSCNFDKESSKQETESSETLVASYQGSALANQSPPKTHKLVQNRKDLNSAKSPQQSKTYSTAVIKPCSRLRNSFNGFSNKTSQNYLCRDGLQRSVRQNKMESSSEIPLHSDCKSHRDVFWSMRAELQSSVDFNLVLGEMIELNVFSEEQLKKYDGFEGRHSDAVLRAVGERIEENEGAMGAFLLAVRPHYPDVVNKIHLRTMAAGLPTVKAVITRRDFPGVCDRMKTAKSEPRNPVSSSNSSTSKSSMFRRYGNSHQASPYSRRPFTINTARDRDHVTNLQRNYLAPQKTNRYFSKESSLKHSVIDPRTILLPDRMKISNSQSRYSRTNSNITPRANNASKSNQRTQNDTATNKAYDVSSQNHSSNFCQMFAKVNAASDSNKKSFTFVHSESGDHECCISNKTPSSNPTQESILIKQENVGILDKPEEEQFLKTTQSDDKVEQLDCRGAPIHIKFVEQQSVEIFDVIELQEHDVETKSPAHIKAIGNEESEDLSSSKVISDKNIINNKQLEEYSQHKQPNDPGKEQKKEIDVNQESIDAEQDSREGLDRIESTFSDPTKLNLKFTKGAKRSASFQGSRSKSSGHEEKLKAKRSDLLKNFFEKQEIVPRPRANSLSEPHSTTVPESNQSSIKEIKYENVEALRLSFKCIFNDDGVTSENEILQDPDADAVLKELVQECIVSARSSWIIRRCANTDERRVKVIDLLAGLTQVDVKDVVEKCATTVAFVRQACNTLKTNKETVHTTLTTSDFCGVSNLIPLISPGANGSSADYPQSSDAKYGHKRVTNIQNVTNKLNSDAMCRDLPSKVVDDAVNKTESGLIANAVGGQNKEEENERKRHCDPLPLVEGLCEKGVEAHSAKACQQSKQYNDKTAQLNDCTVSVKNSPVAKRLTNPVFPLKGKLLEKTRSNGGKGKGNFVSQVLFPISKRKNAESRRSLKLELESRPGVSVDSEDSEGGVEIIQLLKGKVTTNEHLKIEFNDMPPVLTVTPTRKFYDSFIEVSGTAEVPTLPLADNEKPARSPTTILTNGGNVSPTSGKKKGARVSFSCLPPIEIDLGPPDVDCSLDVTEQVVKSNSSPLTVVVDESETTKTTGCVSTPVIISKNKKSKPINHTMNEIDQINELLMDILEEIEAENVSLDQCLCNLVRENLLSEHMATGVSPSFAEAFARSPSPTQTWENSLNPAAKEAGVEKLLDVLTNLGLETLSRCRNSILGRLCQLSSYEDFENAQKAAAAASDSPPGWLAMTCTPASVTSQDAFRSRSASGRMPSSEESELSATESDEDFHSLRHQMDRRQREVEDGNLTIKEVEEEHGSDKEPPVDVNHNVVKADACDTKARVDIKSTLPILIDEGVLEPRQAWLILGAGDEEAQSTKLREFLGRADRSQVLRLTTSPSFQWLHGFTEEPQSEQQDLKPRVSFLKARERFQKSPSRVQRSRSLCNSSRVTGEPGNPKFSEVADLIREHAAARERQEERLSPLQTILAEAGLKGSQSVKRDMNSKVNETFSTKNDQVQDTSTPEASTLEEWCRLSDLPARVADLLGREGFVGMTELLAIGEREIDVLSGLSWIDKARLWVALENTRLEEFYRKSHSGLTDILKALGD